jgi:hypothetical protein
VPAAAVATAAVPTAAVAAGINHHWRGGGWLLNRCGFSHGRRCGHDGHRGSACRQNWNDLRR